MFKKLYLIFFLIFIFFVSLYPTTKENIQIFNYCFAFEKIISKNSIKTKKNLSGKVKSISKDIAKFGLRRTKGALINKIIDQYKTSKNNVIIKLVPNGLYCFAGYWIETIKPGTFESILYQESQKRINEIKKMTDEVDSIISDINSEYKIIKEEFLDDINSEYQNIKKDLNNFFK